MCSANANVVPAAEPVVLGKLGLRAAMISQLRLATSEGRSALSRGSAHTGSEDS